jgi:hypothetical protein
MTEKMWLLTEITHYFDFQRFIDIHWSIYLFIYLFIYLIFAIERYALLDRHPFLNFSPRPPSLRPRPLVVSIFRFATIVWLGSAHY